MKKYVSIIISCLLVIMCSAFAFADSPDNTTDNTGYTTDKISTEVRTEVVKISASDTTGLHSIVLSLIGDYNPIVKDYTYQSSSGYYNHSIEITPDYSWIMTCALFIVVIFCVFRIIGLALGGIK